MIALPRTLGYWMSPGCSRDRNRSRIHRTQRLGDRLSGSMGLRIPTLRLWFQQSQLEELPKGHPEDHPEDHSEDHLEDHLEDHQILLLVHQNLKHLQLLLEQFLHLLAFRWSE